MMSDAPPSAPAPRGAEDLLKVLDAAVKRDGASPRLFGRVSIGVRDDGGAFHYWTAELTEESARTGFFDKLPTSEVALVMDEGTAHAVLAGDKVRDPALLAIEGDERLLERFFARYFQRRSWLDIRAGG